MTFGEKIKQLRKMRGWSQYKLAEIAGIPRGSLASIESDRSKPKTGILLKLARAFGIPIEDLYKAAGYGVEEKLERREEKLEELAEKFLLALPASSIPVYKGIEIYASETREEPVKYIFRRRELAVGRKIEAYIVRRQHLELDVSDGDLVLVDRDLPGEAGDVVLCLVDRETVLGRLVMEDNVLWLVADGRKLRFEECQTSAKVIEIRKKLE